MIRRVHPARPWGPILVSASIVGGWWLVAHNSGAGWMQTLGDAVFATLCIGIFGPAVVLARAKVRVVEAPADGSAGLPLEVKVSASSRVRLRLVEPDGAETLAGPVWGKGEGDAYLTVLPARRGVHDALTVDVATAAPFGLQWWTKRVALPLPAPLHVAPRRGEAAELPPISDENSGDSVLRVPAPTGEARGVRAYEWGDSRRHIHWHATAHTGEIMVREMEGPASEPVTVAVRLPSDDDEAERAAERAFATVLRLIERGTPVVLTTDERSGSVTAQVQDRRAAGRRLARAVAAPGLALGVPAVEVSP